MANGDTSRLDRTRGADAAGESVSVLMYPDSTASNPYQSNLRDALRERGVDVEVHGGHKLSPLVGLVREHGRPDVIHIHWLGKRVVTDSSVLTAVLGIRLLVELLVVRAMGVRVVWTVHNLLGHESPSPRLELWAKRLTADRVDGLVVHCEAARERVVESFRVSEGDGPAIATVPHGHYLDNYPDTTSTEAARSSLGIDPEDDVFLFFGSIRKYKRVPHLVETFRSLDAPDTHLLVAGRPWNDAIERRVAEEVKATPNATAVLEYVPDEDVQRYFQAADAVVLPFDDQMTSGSAVLAMSFGCPVVAPRLGCVGELLEAQSCLGYDPDRTDGLRRAMEEALEVDTAEVGERDRQLVAKRDWDGVAAATCDLYRTVLGPAGR
jgi:glycosyltransferase involved in cell wall biosynthesis